MVMAVLGIILMRRVLPTADPYLRWPAKASHWALAAGMGLCFAVIMFVADFWPQLMFKTRFPKLGYEITPVGVPGWLIGSLGAGPNEELIFRGVLVGMLTVLIPGRMRLSWFDVPVSAVIVALLFAIAHYPSFFRDPLLMALAQQTYAVIWAVFYVWLMERANSIAAPMLAHGLSDASEVAVTMIFLTWQREAHSQTQGSGCTRTATPASFCQVLPSPKRLAGSLRVFLPVALMPILAAPARDELPLPPTARPLAVPPVERFLGK